MTAASLPHLRPLSLGELLDQAIRLYRRNFLKFVGIIAVVQVPLALLGLLTSLLTFGGTLTRLQDPAASAADNPFELLGTEYFVGIAGSIILGVVSLILVQGVATAATTRAVADNYLGETTGMLDAYRKIGRAWLPLLLALLLALLVWLGLFVWLIVPCVGWMTGLGVLVFYTTAIVPLIAPVVVLEKQPATSAIRRAWDLARRRFWWVLGFVVVLYVFAQLIVAGPTALVGFLFQFVVGNPLASDQPAAFFTLQTVLQSLVSLVTSLIYLPLQVTCITLMYFDLRVRTEGFDLALLAADKLEAQPGFAEVAAQAPAPERGSLVTWQEIGYFALIEVAAFGLYCLLSFAFAVLMVAAMAAAGGLY